jgi:hypothetical protein
MGYWGSNIVSKKIAFGVKVVGRPGGRTGRRGKEVDRKRPVRLAGEIGGRE